ncbi:MAG: putative lipid II flippase FtsW [Alphaproteobacteria bacterium]|nr:putative lipid II flippase FtsW [Alphaproteobacteria bacterium]
MIGVGRTDRSAFGDWWWTVDRWLLVVLLLLIAAGAILVMAASPAVADRLGLDSFHFVRRQLIFLVPGLAVVFVTSLLPPILIRRLAVIGLLVTMLMLVATLFFGHDVKGARRWLSLGGLLLQPSEFAKPLLAVVCAWLLAQRAQHENFPSFTIVAMVAAVVIGLVVIQPDVGMAMVIAAVTFTQMFLAGLPLILVAGLALAGASAAVGAYALFPHVASRIDRFLDPSRGDTFQVDTSINAFSHGGLFGTGPGEGVLKTVLPDAHADFIFAVAGEEFGLLPSLGLIVLFAVLLLRGFARLFRESEMFNLLAAAGILSQLGLQAVINMGVNMSLLPAKGMTLPFISYGGSSMLALAFGMGIVLALTRQRAGGYRPPVHRPLAPLARDGASA